MLTLTPEAAEAIRDLIDDAGLAVPAGLRMDLTEGTLNGGPPGLSSSIVNSPLQGDQVIAEGGARLYVASRAAALIDGKQLDARSDGDHVTFLLNELPE